MCEEKLFENYARWAFIEWVKKVTALAFGWIFYAAFNAEGKENIQLTGREPWQGKCRINPEEKGMLWAGKC